MRNWGRQEEAFKDNLKKYIICGLIKETRGYNNIRESHRALTTEFLRWPLLYAFSILENSLVHQLFVYQIPSEAHCEWFILRIIFLRKTHYNSFHLRHTLFPNHRILHFVCGQQGPLRMLICIPNTRALWYGTSQQWSWCLVPCDKTDKTK